MTRGNRPRLALSGWLGIVAAGVAASGGAAGPSTPDAARLRIAEHGRSRYRIVIPDAPSPSQRYAAEELARFVKAMSGAKLPIVPDQTEAGTFEIVLGDGRRLKPAGVAPDWARLGDEGFTIQTAGQSVFIAGSAKRGTLYGVYELLDRIWGCRWYTTDVSMIPRHDPLTIPAMSATRIPALESREVYWTEALDGTWAARNRLNSSDHSRSEGAATLEPRHGGQIVYKGFVHTMDELVPPELFDEHPEYFALRAGKRQRDRAQRCLTDPEVLAVATGAVRRWLRETPEADIVSVSQNDNWGFCTCERCAALDDSEGSHAGSMLTFANRVAEAIEPEYPRVAIDTLAYQYTRKPPRTVRPRANVIVRLCAWECCVAHPLAECRDPGTTAFMSDLNGWGQLTKRVYLWDYTTNFSHYLLPFPNLGVLDRNLRTFASRGVKGVFDQGNSSKGGGGELAELRSWVLARLLWDPDQDGEALIREFVRGVYGPAAKPVETFLKLQREASAAADEHVHIYDGAERRDLEPAILRACDASLEEAERIAKSSGDRALVSRVTRLRMPIWYVRMARRTELLEAAIKPAVRRLIEGIRSLNLTQLREGHDIAPDLASMAVLLKRTEVRPAIPGTLVGEDSRFVLYQKDAPTSPVEDLGADDNGAMLVEGRFGSWDLEWNMPRPPADAPSGRDYLLRVRLRTEQPAETGWGLSAVVWDSAERCIDLATTISATAIRDERYHTYDLGPVKLAPRRYVYMRAEPKDAVAKAIHFDRFELVPIAP